LVFCRQQAFIKIVEIVDHIFAFIRVSELFIAAYTHLLAQTCGIYLVPISLKSLTVRVSGLTKDPVHKVHPESEKSNRPLQQNTLLIKSCRFVL
jgi:hypothetical protein